MRRLDRAAVPAPGCLIRYSYPANCWNDVTPPDKEAIRFSLEQMQGRRCAYCEGSVDALGQHIEHFRRKGQGHSPELTFTWSNLYWSCYQDDSCGRFKDHDADPYDVRNLLDPCSDDPDRFFRFRSDGTISIRDGLSEADKRRAEETLRIFNLDAKWGRLRNMRKIAVLPYVSIVAGCEEMPAQELQTYLSDELAQVASSPFYTAIRHVLTEP